MAEEETSEKASPPIAINVRQVGFRENAKVWDLYLDLAEFEAKERAMLWNTSLDSLLIFAGLFAGVVSSFVIDARSDLQADSTQRSLTGLLEIAQSGSVTDILTIPMSAQWISGLWVVSLCTTLFCAVMAVLGKAWLAKYIIASPRRRAKDAYRRYRLDAEAGRWHATIALVLPLLVQLASFLFVVGLIIQLHGDSLTIGRILLSFAVLGICLYTVMTCLPLLSPSTPISTPLTDLLSSLLSVSADMVEQPTFGTGMDHALCQILYGKLIMSEKAEIIDAAIAEISFPLFVNHWAHVLWKTETPRVLLWRMRHYATSTQDDLARKQEILSRHLSLFIVLAEVYEEELMKTPVDAPQLQNIPLYDVIRHLVSYGYPAHRLYGLPEACWPMLLRLRGHLLVLLKQFSTPVPTDLENEEVRHRPWERAHSNIHSSHRIHVSLASCRGLTQGSGRLKAVSGFIMSMNLGKAALLASETGRTSEWAKDLGKDERENVNILALRYIARLHRATVAAWGDMTVDAFRETHPDEAHLGDADGILGHDDIPGCLAFGLSQPNRAVHIHAIRMLKYISLPNPALFSSTSIKNIITRTIYDDQGVRDDGLGLLIKLAQTNEPTTQTIRYAVIASIQLALSRNKDQPRLSTLQFIEKLSTLQGPENLFVPCISEAVPDVVRLSLDNSTPSHIRRAALRLSQGLWSETGFTGVKGAILSHLGSMLEDPGFHFSFLDYLQVLLKSESFNSLNRRPYTFPWYFPEDFIRDIMATVLGKLVEMATYEEDVTISTEAQESLRSLAKSDRFTKFMPPLELEVTAWLDALTTRPSRWHVRYKTLLVVGFFSGQLPMSPALFEVLLVTALKDANEAVRGASLELVMDLWKNFHPFDYNMAPEVKKIILSESHKKAIQDGRFPGVAEKWCSLLGETAKHVAFTEAISIIIQVAVAKTTSPELISKAVTVLSSEGFTKELDFHEAVKKNIPADLQVKLPGDSQFHTKVRWVKFLVALLPQPEIRDLAKAALAGVISSAKEWLSPVPAPEERLLQAEARAKDNNPSSPVSPGNDSFMVKSDIAPPLRQLLKSSSVGERAFLVETLSGLAEHFPGDFPDASKTILQIIMHDPTSDVRNTALQSLRRLSERDATRESFLSMRVQHLYQMADHDDWSVRFALARLLASMGTSRERKLPELVLGRLITMALEDRDHDVRSESINSLAVLVANEVQYQSLLATVLDRFQEGTKDAHWKPRQSWIEFILPHIKDASSSHVTLLFDTAIGDGDRNTRRAAVAALEKLLTDTKLRDGLASKVGNSLASAIKNGDHPKATSFLLAQLTAPKPTRDETTRRIGNRRSKISLNGRRADPKRTATPGHEVWLGVTMLLGRHDFQGVPKIIEMAIKDAPEADYMDLMLLFQKVKLQGLIQTALPKYLGSALKSEAPDARKGAVTLLDLLFHSENSSIWDYGGLLDEANDPQLISRLAEITVKDDDRDLRVISLDLLKLLLDEGRFHDLVNSSLSKLLRACFEDADLMKFRMNAIEALHDLTEANSSVYYDDVHDIVSPSIPHLTKILLATDREHEYIRKGAEDVLLGNLASSPSETKLNREVFGAIPAMIPTITAGGKRVALRLVETLQMTGDTAASVIHALTPHLRTVSSVPRVAAVELLVELCSNTRALQQRFIESTLPEIIALALDEKYEVGGARTTAIQLLVSLSSSPIGRKVVEATAPLTAKLVGLLQEENSRPSVAGLLSLMSTDAAVRRTISLHTIALALGTDDMALQLEGHCELLARLISEGRLGDEPIDKVMLFLASTIVTRPRLAQYRFQILTALWCRYGSKSIVPVCQEDRGGPVKQLDGLVEWFTFAMFGRHATTHEVRAWLEKCKAWLPDEPGSGHERVDHSRSQDPDTQARLVVSSGRSSAAPAPAEGPGERAEEVAAPKEGSQI